ncbi:VOC family protein [bacterium]|nr:VOC family protein [bacterium]
MRISRVRLECTDPEQLRDFYSRVLGMPLIGGGVQAGRTRLEFVAGQAHRYHLAFNWPPNQWQAGIEWLSARTPLVADSQGETRFEFESWRARSVYFWDPAGNLMEAIVRDRVDQEKPDPEWLCVSEVGLVVESVAETRKQLNLPIFGPCREDFCALGDDEGLLIVARKGRVWYPTDDLAAAPAPVLVEWEGGQFDSEIQAGV